MGHEQNRFHITDEGEVFKINDDGSFTSLGNAKQLSKHTKEHSYDNGYSRKPHNYRVKKKSSQKTRIIITIIALLIVAIGAIFALNHSNTSEVASVSESPSNLVVSSILNQSVSSQNEVTYSGYFARVNGRADPITMSFMKSSDNIISGAVFRNERFNTVIMMDARIANSGLELYGYDNGNRFVINLTVVNGSTISGPATWGSLNASITLSPTRY